MLSARARSQSVVALLICALVAGCGGTPTAAPPSMPPRAWGQMSIVEVASFVPLKNLDFNGTGEVLLVGVLNDATGSILFCTDDNAKAAESNTPPDHVPIEVKLNQPVNLPCKGVAAFQDDYPATLTFVAFERDSLAGLAEFLDIVVSAVELAAPLRAEPKAAIALTIAGLITNGLTHLDLLETTDIIGVYHQEIRPGMDFWATGDEDENLAFRIHFRTSPLLDPNMPTPNIPEPIIHVSPASQSKPLYSVLLPESFYVCERGSESRSCKGRGGLNLRSTPCSLSNKRQDDGGNIIVVIPNGTHVRRIRDGIVPSECTGSVDDGVIAWMYIRTESGHEGYMSASLTYLIPDFDE